LGLAVQGKGEARITVALLFLAAQRVAAATID
jgi:hypothetical protein